MMEYDERFIPDGMNGFERNVKRIVDCMIAVILMILFSPLFLICYLAVKSEDGGPAIFLNYGTFSVAIWLLLVLVPNANSLLTRL